MQHRTLGAGGRDEGMLPYTIVHSRLTEAVVSSGVCTSGSTLPVFLSVDGGGSALLHSTHREPVLVIAQCRWWRASRLYRDWRGSPQDDPT